MTVISPRSLQMQNYFATPVFTPVTLMNDKARDDYLNSLFDKFCDKEAKAANPNSEEVITKKSLALNLGQELVNRGKKSTDTILNDLDLDYITNQYSVGFGAYGEGGYTITDQAENETNVSFKSFEFYLNTLIKAIARPGNNGMIFRQDFLAYMHKFDK